MYEKREREKWFKHGKYAQGKKGPQHHKWDNMQRRETEHHFLNEIFVFIIY